MLTDLRLELATVSRCHSTIMRFSESRLYDDGPVARALHIACQSMGDAERELARELAEEEQRLLKSFVPH